MYNYKLATMINDSFNVTILSEKNEMNRVFYKNKGINFFEFKREKRILIDLLYRINLLNNGLRSFNDYESSRIIAEKLSTQSDSILEFMDIHSESYVYQKRFPKNKRNTKVIIRSHTPWGLLKKYFLPKEIKGVDAWWAFKREKFCFENCDLITVPSKDLKARLIDIYKINDKKIVVLPNIIDTDHFRPNEKPNISKQFSILYLGRVERGKGVGTLIDAFIKFAEKYKKASLILLGHSNKKFLKESISKLKNKKILDRVEIHGFVDYDDLPKWYNKASLVVAPSEIYESFSYTVAQAMSCGKAVIASKIGGVLDTVDNGESGSLFSPGNKSELFKKIEELYLDKEKRKKLGFNARAYVQKNFSMETLKPRYIELYKSIKK